MIQQVIVQFTVTRDPTAVVPGLQGCGDLPDVWSSITGCCSGKDRCEIIAFNWRSGAWSLARDAFHTFFSYAIAGWLSFSVRKIELSDFRSRCAANLKLIHAINMPTGKSIR